MDERSARHCGHALRNASLFIAATLIMILAAVGVAGSTHLLMPALLTPAHAAGAAAIRGEVLVKLRPSATASQIAALHGRTKAAVSYRSRLTRWQAVRPPQGTDPQSLLRAYRADPSVEAAEFVRARRITKFANDLRRDQWALHNTGRTLSVCCSMTACFPCSPVRADFLVPTTPDADIDAPEAWDLSVGSTNVVVAILDTGVDHTRGDLSARLVGGFDFVNNDSRADDDQGHGTAVASVIGAVGNNDAGMTGAAWRVSLMPFKICDSQGFCDFSAELAAIDEAVASGADVINMSLGCDEHQDPFTGACTASLPGSCFTQAERDALAAAEAAGVTVVSSAGNCGADNDDSTSLYPCAHDIDGLICAGATSFDDSASFFSNFGPVTVDIGAPGELVLGYGISPPGGFFYLDGTSFSAPVVSGVAALLLSRTPLTPAAVRERIVEGGDPGAGTTTSFEGGRLNAFNALRDVFLDGLAYSSEAPGDVNLLADLNGDGRADLIRGTAGTGFQVAFALAKPRFRTSVAWSGTSPTSVVLAGDVDADGRSDVILGDATAGFQVLRSAGAAALPVEDWSAEVPGTLNAAGDFDGDGLTDIMRHAGDFEVLLSTGSASGGFAAPDVWSMDTAGDFIAAADVDSDGMDDLVNWANVGSESRIDVGLSNGAAFDASTRWLTAEPLDPNGTLDLAGTGDFDGDGMEDLLGLDSGSGCLMVLRSTGSDFEDPRAWSCPAGITTILAGRTDTSRDARADVVVHAGAAGWRMLRSVR